MTYLKEGTKEKTYIKNAVFVHSVRDKGKGEAV